MRVYVFCFTLTGTFLKFLPLPANKSEKFPPCKTTPTRQEIFLIPINFLREREARSLPRDLTTKNINNIIGI